MADYTYAQLSQMQQEAERRVKEMRKRAKFAADDARQRFESDGKSRLTEGNNQAASLEEPPRKPKTIQMESGLRGQNAELTSAKEQSENIFIPPFLQRGGMNKQKKRDNCESDRAMLLSLLFLLQAENADEGLRLALLYLLG